MNRIEKWQNGESQAKIDYLLGYVSKFLELHKAPEEVRAAFEDICKTIIDATYPDNATNKSEDGK